MCVIAVEHSVLLHIYLRHDSYNIIFKIEHKFYTAPGSASPHTENF